MTRGVDLIAPASLHWEIGNAFSAMLKRKRIHLKHVTTAMKQYNKIPIRFHETDLNDAIIIAEQLNIYAYDAYFLSSALHFKAPLLTLDRQLVSQAKYLNLNVIEVV